MKCHVKPGGWSLSEWSLLIYYCGRPKRGPSSDEERQLKTSSSSTLNKQWLQPASEKLGQLQSKLAKPLSEGKSMATHSEACTGWVCIWLHDCEQDAI